MVKLRKPNRGKTKISVNLYAGGTANEGCNCCAW